MVRPFGEQPMRRVSPRQNGTGTAAAIWRRCLHLLVAAALALSALAPAQVVVAPDASGDALLGIDGNGFAICQALPPDDAPAPERSVAHCKACVLVGHALAVAATAPAALLPGERATARTVAAPVAAPPPAIVRDSPPARAPPVLA